MSKTDNNYNKILLLDKPSGITSHDAIDKLRSILKQRRIGHTGTLDKAASGLMIICLGKSTKISQFISDYSKTYEAKISLGRSSETFDSEGVDFSMPENEIPTLKKNEIEIILNKFKGQLTQTVPSYSAVHVNGRRLYDYARSGQKVDLPSRTVEIKDIELLGFNSSSITIKVECSKGTYIRSLANDIGNIIGCGAYLSELKRTSIGKMNLSDALNFQEIEALRNNNSLNEYLKSYSEVLSYNSFVVPVELTNDIICGKDISCNNLINIDGDVNIGDKITIKDTNGQVLAVGSAGISSDMVGIMTEDKKLFDYLRVLN
jgi:tRNA pseudouridine55 synthase